MDIMKNKSNHQYGKKYFQNVSTESSIRNYRVPNGAEVREFPKGVPGMQDVLGDEVEGRC